MSSEKRKEERKMKKGKRKIWSDIKSTVIP